MAEKIHMPRNTQWVAMETKKKMPSGHFSPGKQVEFLAAFSSDVYGPRDSKLGGKVEDPWEEFNRPLVSMETILLSCKLENALTAHILA